MFISYSRKDTTTVDMICDVLDKANISYFIDRKGIDGGMEFPKVLAEEINECKVFLFVGSKFSYESKFTNSEVTYAFNKKPKNQILPYLIDDTPLPSELEFVFSSINIRNIKEHPIDTVLPQDIKAILDRKVRNVSKPDKKRMNKLLIVGLAAIALTVIAVINTKHSNSGIGDKNQIEAEESLDVFKNEESVRKFLSSTKFVSTNLDTITFVDDFSAELLNGMTMTLISFKIEDLRANSAHLMIEYAPNSRFDNILGKDSKGYYININGGGYKYYAIP